MEEFQKRVIDEKIELDGKRKKLEEFLASAKKTAILSANEMLVLRKQQIAMSVYSKILDERIDLFERKKS